MNIAAQPKTGYTRARWRPGILAVTVVCFITAFALVYIKDLNRRLFIHYQHLLQVRQQAQVEWSKLLLEQSTWATQARVQRIANQKLHMIVPTPQDIVMLKEPKSI